MQQWLWVLFIEEYTGRRSIINAGVVNADTKEEAGEKAQEKIGFNLMPGMVINLSNNMELSAGQLMNLKGE
jgi:hypothetical protein